MQGMCGNLVHDTNHWALFIARQTEQQKKKQQRPNEQTKPKLKLNVYKVHDEEWILPKHSMTKDGMTNVWLGVLTKAKRIG